MSNAKEFKGLPRFGVTQIDPYVPGARPRVGQGSVLRLASNENAYGCSASALTAYQEAAEELNRYPDGACTLLRDALAGYHDIAAGQIVCGAGSDELISVICRAYAGPGDEVVYSQYGFLMYKIAALTAGAEPVMVQEKNYQTDLEAMLAAVTEATKIVFIANPNNPTGSYVPAAALKAFRSRLRSDVLLVLDAAYSEYVRQEDYDAGDDLVDEFGNVVILRTFSKIYGLAALRLGWAYCPPNVAEILNRVRGPFNVNAPAQAAGVAALRDVDHIRKSIEDNDRVLRKTVEALQQAGYKILPSVANFLTVDMTKFHEIPEKSQDLTDKLNRFLCAQGILVRPLAAYGLPCHVRVTIGSDSDMERVVKAFVDFSLKNLRSAA